MSIRGAKLYVDVVGQGSPAVLLHGGPGLDQTYLRPYFQDLERHHQLIYYDQRCTGRSEGNPNKTEVTLRRFLADLEAIRKGLQLPQFDLIGHSWGSLLGLKYALTFPEHVRSLVMISPFPPTSDGLQSAIQRMLVSRNPEEQENLTRLAASEGVLRGQPDAVNKYLQLIFSTPQFTFEAQTAKNSLLVANLMRNDLGRYDVLKEVHSLACPTLTIVGSSDVVALPGAQQLHQHLPNDQLLLLDDIGQFPFIQAQRACTDAIQAFLCAGE